MTKRRLGELLRAEGLITDDQLRAALEEQRKSNLFLGEALVKLGFVSEEVIAATIVQQFNLPFIAAGQFAITPEVLNTFPERMYFEYQFLAVDKIGRTLIIVGAGLMNHDVLDELERLSGCKVCQFVSTWKEIRGTIDAHAKDFQKEQSDLSSLGSMLLDAEPVPRQPLRPHRRAPNRFSWRSQSPRPQRRHPLQQRRLQHLPHVRYRLLHRRHRVLRHDQPRYHRRKLVLLLRPQRPRRNPLACQLWPASSHRPQRVRIQIWFQFRRAASRPPIR